MGEGGVTVSSALFPVLVAEVDSACLDRRCVSVPDWTIRENRLRVRLPEQQNSGLKSFPPRKSSAVQCSWHWTAERVSARVAG